MSKKRKSKDVDNRRDLASKLRDYLGHFGEFSYIGPDFTDLHLGRFNYATIMLVTTQEIAEDLEGFVNSQLTEANGIPASLRMTALNELEDGKYKHCAEIVLRETVPRTQRDYYEATQEYLHRLPKVIKEFAGRHCRDEDRKARERIRR